MKRYFCKECHRAFSIDHREKQVALWIPHIDGIPFRKLGDEYSMSAAKAYRAVFKELAGLPESLTLTKELCSYPSGILVIDGKYIKVRGYKERIPFIYVIDYETHDILFGFLCRSEDETAFLKIFLALKTIDYPLSVVVADDRSSLPLALKQVFPDVPLQLCQNHYIENIREALHLRTDPTHHHFFNSLKKHVFDEYVDDQGLDAALHHVLTEHCEGVYLREHIVMNIHERRRELFVYKTINNCPKDTNLIELFNSHMNPRLRAIKGFKSKEHAVLWLNGLVIRRRTKSFTDCSPKFKHLNGKCSLQMSIKKQAPWPEILGVHAPNLKR